MEYINRILKIIEKIKNSDILIRIQNYWYSSSNKRKIAIVAIIAILITCCLCNIFPSGEKINATKTPTHLIAELKETDFSEIDLKTEIAKTIFAEVEQTRIAESTETPEPNNIDVEIQEDKKLVVTFIDVGQGDAILIRSPEGYYALIDGGEQGSGVINHLRSNNIKNIDVVIATHPHSDHIGGLVDVIKNFQPKKIITNGEMHTTITYENFLDAIISSQADYIEVSRGDYIDLGSIKFDVLHPGDLIEGDLNRNSLVLSLEYLGTKFLFTGDANFESELELIRTSMPLNADILKVGHHGSNTSTSKEFLNSVEPKISVYSAGRGNSYGHPTKDTILRLIDSGAQIFGTDINRTITIEVNELGYKIIPTIEENIADQYIIGDIGSQKDISGDLSISVVSLTSPVRPGGNASLKIQTTPGANCIITVYYKSGPSQAAGLGHQIANSNGHATWNWKVGSQTTPGIWEIIVQASIEGKSVNLSIPFEVRK